MVGAHHAHAGRNRRRVDAIDAEVDQPERRPNDIDDRVRRAELVERHVADVCSVHRRFRFREAPVDRERHLARALGKLGVLDHRPDAEVVAEDAGVLAANAHGRRPDPETFYPGRLHLEPLDLQLSERLLERFERNAGVDQRAEHHVTGNAAEAVEVPERRHERIFRMRAASAAAPNPLSMLTTVTPAAQELSIPSSAAMPPNDAP